MRLLSVIVVRRLADSGLEGTPPENSSQTQRDFLFYCFDSPHSLLARGLRSGTASPRGDFASAPGGGARDAKGNAAELDPAPQRGRQPFREAERGKRAPARAASAAVPGQPRGRTPAGAERRGAAGGRRAGTSGGADSPSPAGEAAPRVRGSGEGGWREQGSRRGAGAAQAPRLVRPDVARALAREAWGCARLAGARGAEGTLPGSAVAERDWVGVVFHGSTEGDHVAKTTRLPCTSRSIQSPGKGLKK